MIWLNGVHDFASRIPVNAVQGKPVRRVGAQRETHLEVII